MNQGQIVLIVFAVFILFGGYMGSRAGSKASLIAGSASGTLLLVALVVSFLNLSIGLWIGAAVSILLCVSFVGRLAKTRKFMPSGMLLVLSVVAAALLLQAALAT